ncbi:MAG: helix-turn-helix domain-containing protein [Humibacillus sp.]|nr:helix-turn-helix domain-containing protein [Humibacillus sp.]MDN5779073.1 helix-turn-helix domain-containing protein [Humibacillus sp.]
MSSEETVRFGTVIREARKGRGWSQSELGDRSGVSRPTIARVEANSDVTTATIAKIAKALGLQFGLRSEREAEPDAKRLGADDSPICEDSAEE